MTRIQIVRNNPGDIVKISGTNHSPPGNHLKRTLYRGIDRIFRWFSFRSHQNHPPIIGNIVCASITTVFEQMQAAVEHLPDESISTNRVEGSVEWVLEIKPDCLSGEQMNLIQTIFESGNDVLKRISDTYPESLQIEYASE